MRKRKKEPASCLFCGRLIPPPQEQTTEIGDVIYGKCECSAIYVCEPSGYRQGEALLNAMMLVSPEGIENIEFGVSHEFRERDYDFKTHQYYIKNRPFSGKIFFIKTVLEDRKLPMKERISINKKDFISLIDKREFEKIEKISLQKKSSIDWLISLSYDKEGLISWKAIEAMGHIAKAYIEAEDSETLRNTTAKLLWSMSDGSGAVGWRSAELLSEVVYAQPLAFEDIIPILWSHKQEESFLESVLRGILRVSQKVNLSDYIKIDCEELKNLLKHSNDNIKGLSVLLIKRLSCDFPLPEEVRKINILVYNNGKIEKMEVEKAEKFL